MPGIRYGRPTAHLFSNCWLHRECIHGRMCATRRTRVRHDRINSLFGDERLCLMSSYYYLILNAINNIEEKLCFMFLYFDRCASIQPPIYIWRKSHGARKTTNESRPTVFVPKNVFDDGQPIDCYWNYVSAIVSKYGNRYLLRGMVKAWHSDDATSPVFSFVSAPFELMRCVAQSKNDD